MERIREYLSANASRFEEELKEFLRIPSISADSRRVADLRRAAEFVARQLRQAGLEPAIVETAGHPLVVAEALEWPEAPTLLIYGHYDVQPPDPLDQWITGPFEPTVRAGNLYARGATDDKGQMFTYIKAIEAWKRTHGRLPINVKVLIEGEEEVGSEAIEEYLATNVERLACDYVAISDTCMFGPDRPAVTYGLKGIAYFEVALQGPRRDLHSGTFGGSVQNPANALAELLATLKDRSGRIQLPGFYDDVVELADPERDRIRSLPFREEDYRQEMGVGELFGEAGYGTLERRWVRPTCDVNGIHGGYSGEGAKTVIPATAGAKVSFRLVPNQDPERVERAFRAHLEEQLPPGVTMKITTHHGAKAIVVPLDSAGIRAAARALESAYGVEPVFIREGGSIPIVSSFKERLGADSLLIGFGLSDDNTHSPNEKFCLKDFHRGIRTIAALFDELAKEFR